MTVYTNRVGSLRGYAEPAGSLGTDHSGTLGDFKYLPYRDDDDFKGEPDERNESPMHAQQHPDAKPFNVLLPRRAGAEYTLNWEALDTKVASGVTAAQSPLGLLLSVFWGVENLGTGTTVTGSGSTSSSIDCTDASGIAVGSAIGLVDTNGVLHMREVLSKATNTVVVKQAFPFTPAAAAVVYSVATYAMNTSNASVKSLQLYHEKQGVHDRFLYRGGQLDSMTIETKRGGLNRFKFKPKFADFRHATEASADFSNDGALPFATYTNAKPIVEMDSELRYQAVGTNTYDSSKVIAAAEINFEVRRRYEAIEVPGGLNNIKQWAIVRDVPVVQGDFTIPFEDKTWITLLEARTPIAFSYQLGSVPADGGLLFTVPRAQIIDWKPRETGGQSGMNVKWIGEIDRATTMLSDLETSAVRLHIG